jgi:hypothetical protein
MKYKGIMFYEQCAFLSQIIMNLYYVQILDENEIR